MVSEIHKEMKFYKGIPERYCFDNMVRILNEFTNLRTTVRGRRLNLSNRKNRLYIQFLCNLGLMTKKVKDSSGRADFSINQRGLKFLKDYQHLRGLMI